MAGHCRAQHGANDKAGFGDITVLGPARNRQAAATCGILLLAVAERLQGADFT